MGLTFFEPHSSKSRHGAPNLTPQTAWSRTRSLNQMTRLVQSGAPCLDSRNGAHFFRAPFLKVQAWGTQPNTSDRLVQNQVPQPDDSSGPKWSPMPGLKEWGSLFSSPIPQSPGMGHPT